MKAALSGASSLSLQSFRALAEALELKKPMRAQVHSTPCGANSAPHFAQDDKSVANSEDCKSVISA
jgi:hypothetical protein